MTNFRITKEELIASREKRRQANEDRLERVNKVTTEVLRCIIENNLNISEILEVKSNVQSYINYNFMAIDAENKKVEKRAYGAHKNVFLTVEEQAEIFAKCLEPEKQIETLSNWKKKSGTEYVSDYATVLTFAEKDGCIRPQDEFEIVE